MARSVSTLVAGVAALAAGAGLAGCVTTQDKNARVLLTNARTLASESAVRVTRESRVVYVVRVALVRSRAGGDLVVVVRSSAPRPITDAPISVGIRRAPSRPQYLNGAANLDYYDTHIPVIPPGGSATWVLPGVGLRTVGHGRLFAVVGVPRTPGSTKQFVLPTITARPLQGGHGELQALLQNHSGVPQYGLPVYATALRNGRYVGAARRLVAELDGDRAATVALPLVGTDKQADLALYAPPTIFK